MHVILVIFLENRMIHWRFTWFGKHHELIVNKIQRLHINFVIALCVRWSFNICATPNSINYFIDKLILRVNFWKNSIRIFQSSSVFDCFTPQATKNEYIRLEGHANIQATNNNNLLSVLHHSFLHPSSRLFLTWLCKFGVAESHRTEWNRRRAHGDNHPSYCVA